MDAGAIPVPRGTMIRVSVRLPNGRGAQVITMPMATLSLGQVRDDVVAELIKRLAQQLVK